MKVVIQRAARASVDIASQRVSEIEAGLLILLGVVPTDTEADVDWLVKKCSQLRIFPDSAGVMNRSVIDTAGDVLVVSQFTLAASTRKGNRPSYIGAAGHDIAIPMYELFCSRMSAVIGKEVGRGRFGADMQVSLVNDGPVTIIIDSKNPV